MKRLRETSRVIVGQLSQAFVAVLCLIMVGCTTGQGDVPTIMVTPTADVVPTVAVPTETARPQITDVADTSIYPTPTRTPKPTVPPTTTSTVAPDVPPTPDVPLSPESPWLLFLAITNESRRLWAVNADGTGLTDLLGVGVWTFEAQPVGSFEQGVKVAYVTYTESPVAGPTLKIVSLPSGEVETISPLTDQTGGDPLVSYQDISAAIVEGGLAWSPDGRWLAFVGAMDGGSVDVYAYDTLSRSITRLTDGPAHACCLAWSPGGEYVVHQGFDVIGMSGPEISGMWAARVDGMGAVPLVDQSQPYYYITNQTWLSSTELLFVNKSFDDDSEIRVVDVETGTGKVILKDAFFYAAYAPQHNVWLLERPEWLREEKGGAPLALYKSGERIDISEDYQINFVDWIPTAGAFLGRTNSGEVYTISLEGQVSKLPIEADWQLHFAPWVYVSPDGTLWAWYLYDFYIAGSELWIGEPLQEPAPVQFTAPTGRDTSWMHGMTWSPDSQRILMLGGDGFWIAERPAFELVHVAEGLSAHEWDGWEAEWIP